MTDGIKNAVKAQLEADVSAASMAMKQFDATKSACGLTPDHVKASPEWKAAKASFNRAFQALRNFNGANL